MKKIITLLFLVALTVTGFSQTKQENRYTAAFEQADQAFNTQYADNAFLNYAENEVLEMQSITTPVKQGLFKPVTPFPSAREKKAMLSRGLLPATHKFAVRLDASILVIEVNQNKVTKEWSPTPLAAIGPAISIQSYVPKSATDSTAVNNYGASLGLALGKTIYNPQLAEAKAVLAINIWQYFKFGTTYTFNPPTDISHIGFFFGGGITF